MKITVDLPYETYALAQTVAYQRDLELGDVLSEAVTNQFRDVTVPRPELTVDEHGFPVIHLGRKVTSEEVRAMIEEDEEWEITRGDPDHPYYRDAYPEEEPTVMRGPTGLPEVRFGAQPAPRGLG